MCHLLLPSQYEDLLTIVGRVGSGGGGASVIFAWNYGARNKFSDLINFGFYGISSLILCWFLYFWYLLRLCCVILPQSGQTVRKCFVHFVDNYLCFWLKLSAHITVTSWSVDIIVIEVIFRKSNNMEITHQWGSVSPQTTAAERNLCWCFMKFVALLDWGSCKDELKTHKISC